MSAATTIDPTPIRTSSRVDRTRSTPRSERIKNPTAKARPSVIAPNRAPTVKLESTFAVTTRSRMGVKMNVGRIVPCRNSLQIDITPISAAMKPPARPRPNSARWCSSFISSACVTAAPVTTTIRSTSPTIPASNPRLVRVERSFTNSDLICARTSRLLRGQFEEDVFEALFIRGQPVQGDSRSAREIADLGPTGSLHDQLVGVEQAHRKPVVAKKVVEAAGFGRDHLHAARGASHELGER